MRVIRRLHEERGATLAFVAVGLVVLLASTALSVDFGVMFAKRRGMVNAADAGALAAALTYAMDEAQCGTNDGPATAQADQLATDNVTEAAQESYACPGNGGEGTVTVKYGVDQDLFFAPIIRSGTQHITAEATASWGPAGGSTSVVPLMLSAGRLSDCDIPDGVEEGDHCYFWWDFDPNNPEWLTSAEWGTMGLDSWHPDGPGTYLDKAASCAGYQPSLADMARWIKDGYPGTLALKDPPPTYVCRGSGNFGEALDNAINDIAGQIVPFPVNDPDQQVDKDGNVCAPGGTCQDVDKYALIGYGDLEVVQVWKGKQALDNCPPPPFEFKKFGSLRCLDAVWRGYHAGGILPGGGEDFGYQGVGLEG